MPTDYKSRLYILFAILSLILAFVKIGLHLGFLLFPCLSLGMGLAVAVWNREKALYLLGFLLPLINSVPDFQFSGYPYNYLGLALFFLAGIVLGAWIRRDLPAIDFRWSGFYLLFLVILWISALFLFLRWSNITLPGLAFFKDTPVAPIGYRNSFASIFPVITLFIFSVSPFAAVMVRREKFRRDYLLVSLSLGFMVSVFIGFFQKYVNHDFMSQAWWSQKLGQCNGGFSDFNAFGFFAGLLSLVLAVEITGRLIKREPNKKPLLLGILATAMLFSLLGLFLAGSRGAFIFTIAGFLFVLFHKKLLVRYKVLGCLLFIIVLVFAGGVLRDRLTHSLAKFSQAVESSDFTENLDETSVGRIDKMRESIPVLKNFPVSGVGVGNFLFYLNNIKFDQNYYEDLTLNQYLQVFDETGLVGLALFLLFGAGLVMGTKKLQYRFLFLSFAVVIFFNNYLWFPEVMIFLFLLAGVYSLGSYDRQSHRRYGKVVAVLAILLFIAGNIMTFSALHPSTWLTRWHKPYDYGFWYLEKDQKGKSFNWTKDNAGIFIQLDRNGMYGEIVVGCGAPLTQMKGGRQTVSVYWRGKQLEKWMFTTNAREQFSIEGKPFEKGFLEFRVDPPFNLKSMGLGAESRDLGVQVYLKK